MLPHLRPVRLPVRRDVHLLVSRICFGHDGSSIQSHRAGSYERPCLTPLASNGKMPTAVVACGSPCLVLWFPENKGPALQKTLQPGLDVWPLGGLP